MGEGGGRVGRGELAYISIRGVFAIRSALLAAEIQHMICFRTGLFSEDVV